ncbi:hypothetical protein QYF61_021126 [Mycteria americana]|uniref:Uncharacterized protein n=1 Tax=Mycteria americana TaxID=33587 RepID=A0AAN7PKU6_MYCAM|nr:hypothetical protein QYF61_021126 [Mycteria americana]
MEAGSDRVRKATVHLEFNPVRAVKSSKKGFHRYISSEKTTRENVSLLLNGALVVYPRSRYWGQYCLTSSLMIYMMAKSAFSEGLGRVVDTPDDFAAIHRYLDRQEK